MANLITVAAIQMSSQTNVKENLHTAQNLIQQATAEKSQLVVLPENFAFYGGGESDKLLLAEPFGTGEIQLFLKEMAIANSIWIVAGSIPIQSSNPQKIFAASLLINPQGVCVARYDKIHLFDVQIPGTAYAYQESLHIQAGTDVVSFKTPFARIGLTICYDVRFPELYRELLTQGCDIVCVPSAFTQKTGEAHWEVLLRARAIENLSYVIAPNQIGNHGNDRHTYGHSMIIDPWGKVLAQAQDSVGIITATLDLDQIKQLRRQFPAIEHRRLS